MCLLARNNAVIFKVNENHLTLEKLIIIFIGNVTEM